MNRDPTRLPDSEWRALHGLSHESIACSLAMFLSRRSPELDLVDTHTEEVGDRLYISNRFHGVEEGEPYVVEQHLYCNVGDGVIERAELLCSGFRPRGV